LLNDGAVIISITKCLFSICAKR